MNRTVEAGCNSCLLRDKLSSDSVQEPSCSLRLWRSLIDFSARHDVKKTLNYRSKATDRPEVLAVVGGETSD